MLIGNSIVVEMFLDGKVTMYPGDCLDVLPSLPENSCDSHVGDPPYGLGFMGKDWDKFSATHKMESNNRPDGWSWGGAPGAVAFQAWMAQWAAALIRVLKPGAHLVAFGGTRTYHRMACAIEDAGFEIRDTIMWAYGSGFPKSHDIAKAIDRANGTKGAFGERKPNVHSRGDHVLNEGWRRPWMDDAEAVNNSGREYLPATDAAREWQGWGTALKPAVEPIILARKPLSESTVAANVLKWGCGALNIDACRVGDFVNDTPPGTDRFNRANFEMGYRPSPYGRGGEASADRRYTENGATNFAATPGPRGGSPAGRWPANLIHDGSDEVVAAFPDAPGQQFYVGPEHGDRPSRGIYGDFGARPPNAPRGDTGSAARFFYSAKADQDDRLGSKHPTVKPVDLMQYLVRLVTPKGGLVLDCFAGTGTTGEAAWREGMRAILIERETEYQDDIRRRMALCLAGPNERARESIKAKMRDKPVDHGPLFA